MRTKEGTVRKKEATIEYKNPKESKENRSGKHIQSDIKNKRLLPSVLVIIFVILAIIVATNQQIRKNITQVFGGEIQNVQENEEITVYEDGSALLTDDAAIISSASVVSRTTGTAPFDTDDEPGNDSSPDNDVIRSFDKVTYHIEANIAMNHTEHGSEEANQYSQFRGGIINIEASLPEEYMGLIKWSLEDMTWAQETGTISEDGLTFTAQYQMAEDTITVPGKQALSIVLQVLGAGNQTQINPNFKLWMQGNESNKENEGYEAIEIQDNLGTITVSAKGGYNIKLVSNSGCTVKTNVDFGDGKGEVTGRMYGYGVILQLYGDNEEKGLKGVEAPKGDIHFDINMKLEMIETIDGEKITTDITEQAMPQLWNYKINVGNTIQNPAYGNIPDRNMYFGSGTAWSTGYAPNGMAETDRTNSIYNSGNIYMEQEGNTIKTTINEYAFDGIFPSYNRWYNSSNPSILYNENVGCFSAGYFQAFVPDDEITSDNDKTYNLTIEDSNMQIVTNSGEIVTEQKVSTDDSHKQRHYYIKPGSYGRAIRLMEDNTNSHINGDVNAGYYARGRKSKGQIFQAMVTFQEDNSNDIGTEIKSVNEFIKFDGDGLEPILQADGSPFKIEQGEITEYNIYYLTKKDGTNWINQDERNDAKIEDLNIYNTLEEIPQGYICIGMYLEANIEVENYLTYIYIRMKIKDTAEIGRTYGMVHYTDYYTETLDLTTQTIINPNATYPKPVYSIHASSYKNIEYDENGEIVGGTPQNYTLGNAILVAGADSSIVSQVIDETTGEEKQSYDLAKNEDIVTFKVEPKLEELDEDNPAGVTGATITIKDTLAKGLIYIPGSSNYGEAIEIVTNEDESTTLVFEKYNCNVGETIEPLIFKAQIDPTSANETTLTHTAVIEPDREKIGLTDINYRTVTNQIKVVNLTSHRIYQETDTQIIESNGEIKYTVTYQNNTDTSVPDFQIVDILPYNGDGRGTAYNGTYILQNVKATQIQENQVVDTNNLKLYTTTDIDARNITPKDEGIGNTGEEGIWQEKEIGAEINEAVTVLALKGKIAPSTKIEMEITIKTNNNRAGDMYANTITAQTSKDTEVITTGTVETRVVKRQISGMIWYDTNENGIKDEEESYANRIEVELKKADGSKAVDMNGNEIPNLLTNENGEYTFSNLPMEEYIVEIKTEDKYRLTEANVGTNREINSKFEEGFNGEKQSYVITNLNNLNSPEILENNVNAGIFVKDAKIIVKYLKEDATPDTDEDNVVLKEQDEITNYEKDGEQVTYKIGDSYSTEKAEIADYIVLRNSENTSGILEDEETVVTYYYAYNKQDIEITKVWEDKNDQAGKRPTSIKVTLNNGNETVKEVVLTERNEITEEEKAELQAQPQSPIQGISTTAEVWQTTIEDVEIYDENGQKIEYTIDETENTTSGEEEQGTLDSYIKTINGMVITNTFTQNTERIDIPVTKVWNDNENKAGKRPKSVTLILKREIITNTMSQEDINGDFSGNNSTGESSGNQDITYVEVARATINGTDNPGANSNEWTYTFDNISKYDENNDEITYIVEEIVPAFYTSKVEKVENIESEDSTTEDTEGITEFTITNTFEVPNETIDVEVTKIWSDNNNRAEKRPESTTFVLTGKNAEGQVVVEGQKITLTKANAIDGNVGEGIEENANNATDTSTTWKGIITDLPKYDENADIIHYELSEEALNNIFYTEENTTINQQNKTVTNRFEIPDDKIEIEVNKKWEDDYNELGRRPESVTLYLTGNNQEYEITLTKANAIDGTTSDEQDTSTTWRGTIGNLPKYDVNGDEITYIVDERPIASEFYTKTGIDQESKTITNTFAIPRESIQIPVTKIWEDNHNSKGYRPENIVLQIKEKGTEKVIAEQMVSGNKTTNEGWSYTFEVPKYNDQSEVIEYEIGEREVNNKFYPSSSIKIDQEQKTITNVFTIPNETIELTINKIWIDNEIQANRRPDSVLFVVKNGNQEIATKEITKEDIVEGTTNQWSTTIEGLPKYDENGDEIQYTIEEQEKIEGDLTFYTSSASQVTSVEGEENKKEATITNTFTRPTDTTSITITKKWEDEDNRYNKRPESIEIEIKNGDIIVAEQEITGDIGTNGEDGENNGNIWTHTFTGLDKYDGNGQEIVYTVDEKELVGDAQIYYTKEITGTTITNRMTKIPGTVTVKYVDKYANEEIANRVEKEGIVGEAYSVEEDKKEIAGYTLIEEPEEKEGVFTDGPQEKIYYYAKNAEVVVKYLEKDETESNTDNQVVAEEMRIQGYEGKEYTTSEKQVEGYTNIENTGNTIGTMAREGTEVIYYYAPNAKVTVNYLEEDNTPGDNSDNTVLDTETIEGYVGKAYTTEQKAIPGYTYVKVVGNTEGNMTKEGIEVNYYYAQNTQVTVKYVEQDKTPEDNSDNTVLDTEIIEGYVGKAYETEQKDIPGYTFVEASDNTKGNMTKEGIEVYYYYAQNTSVKVQYIDKTTGEVLEEIIKEGKVGDICKTEAITIPGYILVEEPENANIEMTKEQQVVKYYYLKEVNGVIEKHVDIISGKILEEKTHTGKVGDKYKIEAKEFEGYDLVDDKLPDNAEGEMTEETQEVIYYYIKEASVRVQYLEKGTQTILSEEMIIKGHEGDKYETKAKNIEGYNLLETPENATGTMKVTTNADGTYNTETVVTYNYVKEAGGVLEKHIDMHSGEIIEQELHTGSVGDSYEIEPKEIEGYDLVKEDEEGNSKLPENAKGKMTEEKIEVIYYYEKLLEVRVEYIDKYTGETIGEDKIEGHEGDKYKTKAKEIEGYDIVKEELPENAEGEMTKEEIVVKYYYQRKTEVEIQYIEKETGYAVKEAEIIKGHEGDTYETTAEEIEYYRNIENSGNTKGKMTKEKITVTYYYEKKNFNLELNTWIAGVSIDGIPQIGQNYGNRDELYKIDIHRNKIGSANVKVTYKIRITNTGEIEGTASKITDMIPEGFSYSASDNPIEWKEEGEMLVTEALQGSTIQPGESKEIEIVLRWNNGETNFGEKKNVSVISGVTNPAKYVDMDEKDNSDTSKMLITIETGGLDSRDRSIVLIVGMVIVMLLVTGIMWYRMIKKKKVNK